MREPESSTTVPETEEDTTDTAEASLTIYVTRSILHPRAHFLNIHQIPVKSFPCSWSQLDLGNTNAQ
jgi:hypothetical protein